MCKYCIKQAEAKPQIHSFQSSITFLRILLASQDDRSWTLQRHIFCCMYTKLFYKLLAMSFLSADGLTAAKTEEETGLILLSYVVSITSLLYKGGSLMAWRVHSALLPVLLSQFEPHKRKRAWQCQRRRIWLFGLRRETSAECHSLEGDVLHCGANSPWGSSIRHNLLFTIYRISQCP